MRPNPVVLANGVMKFLFHTEYLWRAVLESRS
jgi:hypothetical protein